MVIASTTFWSMPKNPCGASGSHGSVNGALPPSKPRNFAFSDAVKRFLSALESSGLVKTQGPPLDDFTCRSEAVTDRTGFHLVLSGFKI